MTRKATDPTSMTAAGLPRRIFRSAGRVIGTLFTLVLVVAGTLALVVAVASHFSAPGQYTVFGHPTLSVLSGSMSPTIKTGDLVYDDRISPSQAEHLKVGQVITFTGPGWKTFTHRIHAVEEIDGSVVYQTKGDVNDAPDLSLVSPSQIVGVYRGKIPFGGYVLNALHKPLTLLLLIASPLLWLLSGWLYGLARELEQRDQVPALAGEREVAVM